MSSGASSLTQHISKPTSVFGLQLWVTIVISIVIFIFFILLFIFLYFFYRRGQNPTIDTTHPMEASHRAMDRRLLSRNGWDIEMDICTPEKQVVYSDWSAQSSRREIRIEPVVVVFGVSQGKHYTMKEIELATDGFSNGSIVGIDEYGVVYSGVLLDNTRVAVKKLICKSGKTEEFIGQAEAIYSVRHRNLVKLLGYCTDGINRMLVYEYVDNGILQHWLHRRIEGVSPLTWNIRMNIILGTAKGLAHLHEDSEPKIVHQHIKSSNILLDHQWNPKISNISIGKFLGLEWNHAIAPPPMGMSGYIAPEYAYTCDLDEKSDVYSFGILIMEMISRKDPVGYGGSEIEVDANLVDWLKSMVTHQNYDQIVDPKLPEAPSLKELKRVILIALRCVDLDVENRPKMGDVIHMLEPRDLLLSDEHVVGRRTSRRTSSVENHDINV